MESLPKSKEGRFEIFFDGQCPLCKREIDLVRWMDRKSQNLLLTDIAAPDFSAPSVGKTLDELHREIHGRSPDGTWFVGVDVFRQMYHRVGLGPLVGLSGLPVIRHGLDFGYRVFAKWRYRSAMKRLEQSSVECETSCSPIRNQN